VENCYSPLYRTRSAKPDLFALSASASCREYGGNGLSSRASTRSRASWRSWREAIRSKDRLHFGGITTSNLGMATLSSVFVWGDAFRFSIGAGQFDPKAVFLCVVRLLPATGVRIDFRYDALGLRAGLPDEANFRSFRNPGDVRAIVLLDADYRVPLPPGRSLFFGGRRMRGGAVRGRGRGHKVLGALRTW